MTVWGHYAPPDSDGNTGLGMDVVKENFQECIMDCFTLCFPAATHIGVYISTILDFSLPVNKFEHCRQNFWRQS
jgi:hypothetical protein